MRIAIVGCGLVGSSWAIVFRRAGWPMVLFDAAPALRERAAAIMTTALARQTGIKPPGGRQTQAASLEAALEGADYVQESGPERIEVLAARRPWRDRYLAALVAAKRLVLSEQERTP